MPEEALQIAEKQEKRKAKAKEKDTLNFMQSFREQQGEIRKPS